MTGLLSPNELTPELPRGITRVPLQAQVRFPSGRRMPAKIAAGLIRLRAGRRSAPTDGQEFYAVPLPCRHRHDICRGLHRRSRRRKTVSPLRERPPPVTTACDSRGCCRGPYMEMAGSALPGRSGSRIKSRIKSRIRRQIGAMISIRVRRALRERKGRSLCR